MAFLSFELPAGTFDINVTPDKRSVFMQREVALVNALGQVGGCGCCVSTLRLHHDSKRQAGMTPYSFGRGGMLNLPPWKASSCVCGGGGHDDTWRCRAPVYWGNFKVAMVNALRQVGWR